MSDPRLARLDPRRVTPPPPPPPSSPPPLESLPSPEHEAAPADGPNGAAANEEPTRDGFKLKFCTVCASNQNRSMEAHLRLSLASLPVISFGTGTAVRLPGPSVTQPNVYSFDDQSYAQMHADLAGKDARLYAANGILAMLERNRNVKHGPERWQDWAVGRPRLARYREDRGSRGTEGGSVDVVITCEARCWDAVVDNLFDRGSTLNRPVHVINVDIRDNHEEALVGGRAILDLAESLNAAAKEERENGGAEGWEAGRGTAREGFDQKVPDILGEWQERWPNMPALWTLAWF